MESLVDYIMLTHTMTVTVRMTGEVNLSSQVDRQFMQFWKHLTYNICPSFNIPHCPKSRTLCNFVRHEMEYCIDSQCTVYTLDNQ